MCQGIQSDNFGSAGSTAQHDRRIQTDAARNRLIELAKQYRDKHGLDINFLAFPDHFRKSFPQPNESLRTFRKNGFRAYTAQRPKWSCYDLCRRGL